MRPKTSSQLPGAFLAKQTHGRIPGAVFALPAASPVRRKGQRHPDRNPQRPGQVGGSGIAGDHQVQVAHDGGGVGEIFQTAAQVDEP